MKDRRYKRYTLYFFLLVFLALVAAIIVIVVKNKQKTQSATSSSTVIESAVTVSPTPTVDLTQQAKDEGINVPDGITIVPGPAEATAPAYSNTTTSNSSNSGITIVNNPNVSTSANNGIYIVDNPYESSYNTNSGIYIVENPYENQTSNGITIVDPPSGQNIPSGTTIASGSFTSNTGTGLNTTTTYSAVTSGSNSVIVTVNVSLTHGPLSANGGNVLSVNLGGDSKSIYAASISSSSGSGTTRLGGTQFTVSLSQGQSKTLNLSSTWSFNGNYSGTYISSIKGSGSIYLAR